MAVLDFPANPTVGQEYEYPPHTYVWDGEKWTTNTVVPTDEFVRKTGDTMSGDLGFSEGGVTGSVNITDDAFVVGNTAGAAVSYTATMEWHSHEVQVPDLRASGRVFGELNHERGYMSIQPFGAAYDAGGQAWIYYKDHDNNTPGAGMRGLVIETSNGANGTGGLMDITLNGSLIFHQNRPPTALEVGAASKDEFAELKTLVEQLRAEIELLKKAGPPKS